MTPFSSGIHRLLAVLTAVTACCLLSPEALAQGPDLCLWRKLLDLASCPACGSTRALAAFFHGRLADAWEFNPNVAVTAPVLLAMLAQDVRCALRRVRTPPQTILHFSPGRRPMEESPKM